MERSKNKVSPSVFCTAVMFMLNGVQVSRGSYIAALISASLSLLPLLCFSLLSRLFPGLSFTEILCRIFGDVTGKALRLLLSVYSVFIASLSLNEIAEFIGITSYPEVKKPVLSAFFALVCALAVLYGLGAIFGYGYVMLFFTGLIFIFLAASAFSLYETDNFSVYSDAEGVFSFPFSEAVFVMNLLPEDRKPGLSSVAVSAAVTSLALFGALLILGKNVADELVYPCFAAVSLINVGDFITHTESLSVLIYILTFICRESICLYAASSVFKSKYAVFPVAAVAVALSVFSFQTSWYVAAAVFQFAFPLVTLLVGATEKLIFSSKN